jgi:hypothetical protein
MDRLTIDEQQRFWKALDGFEKLTSKVDEMYSAIVGNEKMGQEGMIVRLQQLEAKVDEMEKQMDKAKGWLAGALFVGSVVGSGLTLFIKYLISKI